MLCASFRPTDDVQGVPCYVSGYRSCPDYARLVVVIGGRCNIQEDRFSVKVISYTIGTKLFEGECCEWNTTKS